MKEYQLMIAERLRRPFRSKSKVNVQSEPDQVTSTEKSMTNITRKV